VKDFAEVIGWVFIFILISGAVGLIDVKINVGKEGSSASVECGK
jgi:hypothetical protein